MAVSILKDLFEESLKFSHKSKSQLARDVIKKHGLATKENSLIVTIRRAIRNGTMDETLLDDCCDVMAVSPLYIQGKQTIRATKKHPKHRIDKYGNYIPSYDEYLVNEVLPDTIKKNLVYRGKSYLEYLFSEYEISSKDGKRYKYKDIVPEPLEEIIVTAIQDYYRQWNYGEYPHITWTIVNKNEEE